MCMKYDASTVIRLYNIIVQNIILACVVFRCAYGDAIATVVRGVVVYDAVVPISSQLDAFTVVGDVVSDDPVGTARSCETYPILVIIPNITVVYEVVARINNVNPLLCVVLYSNSTNSIR